MADSNSTPSISGAKPIDVTPSMVFNWSAARQQSAPSSVLQVSADATVHDRAALAWVWASELQSMANLAAQANDDNEAVRWMLSERLQALENLLHDIADRTAPAAVATA